MSTLLINRRFGRLLVLREDVRPGYVVCRCDCGSEKAIRVTSLTRQTQPTRSCGCIHREAVRNVGLSTIAANSSAQISVNVTFNTNFQVIANPNPPRNNRSGTKGVSWCTSRQCWEAYINVHGKRIRLGRFVQLEDAISARKNAEKLLHEPLVEQRKTFLNQEAHI